jgi:hypothetical protein
VFGVFNDVQMEYYFCVWLWEWERINIIKKMLSLYLNMFGDW